MARAAAARGTLLALADRRGARADAVACAWALIFVLTLLAAPTPADKLPMHLYAAAYTAAALVTGGLGAASINTPPPHFSFVSTLFAIL